MLTSPRLAPFENAAQPRKALAPTRAELPRAIYVELTDLCNLVCPMCRCSPVKGNILPLALFEDIAAALFPTAAFVDLRGWGESTIVPDFERYLDVALRYQVRLKLITNAVVRKPQLWRRLAREKITIGVSFDAVEPSLFRELRGGADLEQVLANLRLLVAESAGAGHDPGEKIYFCITVSGRNLDQLDRIVEVGADLGIRRFKLEPLWAPDTDPQRLERHTARIPEALARLAAARERHGALVELSASLAAGGTRAVATQKVCIHPWQYLYVNSRGRLGFCDHLNGREEFTFGSWQSGDFESFWNGPDMQQLRSEHLRRLQGETIKKCADCNWCYDRRYMDLEDWVDPSWSAYRVVV